MQQYNVIATMPPETYADYLASFINEEDGMGPNWDHEPMSLNDAAALAEHYADMGWSATIQAA